jgi:shikimate dehydrogenase
MVELNISGRTRLYGIVADPIAHVKAPQMLNPRFAAAGHDGVLVPFHVSAANLAALMAGLRQVPNFAGASVTVPHKEAMAKLCDSLTDAARQAGAVNVVRRDADGSLHGAMFDGEGFCAGLLAAGHAIAGKRVLIAGSGGAASGIGFALAAHGAAAITFFNRTRVRAEALAARIAADYPNVAVTAGGPDPAGHDIVVNTTMLGLKPGDALPVDPARLTPDMLAVEIIMDPAETAFMREAAARGCCVHPGRPMLDQQITLIGRFMGAPV